MEVPKSLNEAIRAYFLSQGYTSSASTFGVESSKALTTKYEVPDSVRTVKSKILQAYDQGSLADFLPLWQLALKFQQEIETNEITRDLTQDLFKIEFFCQIHFAVWPLRDAQLRRASGNPQIAASRAARSMTIFKKYLDSRGNRFAQDDDFLPFFAMPYVPNPIEHESFKKVFTNKWIQDLRAQVDRVLERQIHQKKSHPKEISFLQKIFQEYRPNNQLDTSDREREKSTELLSIEKRDKERAATSRQLYAFTAELVEVIEKSVNGSPPAEAFAEFARDRLRTFAQQIVGYHDKPLSPTKPTTPNRKSRPTSNEVMRIMNAQVVGTDFEGLKDEIIQHLRSIHQAERNGEESTQSIRYICLMLQALRKRIVWNASEKKLVILKEYIANDLLDCSKANDPKALLYQLLAVTAPASIREYSIRLINTLATHEISRKYLLCHAEIVPLLVDVLRAVDPPAQEEDDSILHQQTIGALQKLSLDRQAQQILLDQDVIAFYLQELQRYCFEYRCLSIYSLEYGTALLMNLSLRRDGKNKIEDLAEDFLKLIFELLEHENDQVRAYINGSLYAMLTRKSFREKALMMGLDQILRQTMETTSTENRLQLEHILERLVSPGVVTEAHEEAQESGTKEKDRNTDEYLVEDEDAEEIEESVKADHTLGEEEGEALLQKFMATPDPTQVHAPMATITPVVSPIDDGTGTDELENGRFRTRGKLTRTPPTSMYEPSPPAEAKPSARAPILAQCESPIDEGADANELDHGYFRTRVKIARTPPTLRT